MVDCTLSKCHNKYYATTLHNWNMRSCPNLPYHQLRIASHWDRDCEKDLLPSCSCSVGFRFRVCSWSLLTRLGNHPIQILRKYQRGNLLIHHCFCPIWLWLSASICRWKSTDAFSQDRARRFCGKKEIDSKHGTPVEHRYSALANKACPLIRHKISCTIKDLNECQWSVMSVLVCACIDVR